MWCAARVPEGEPEPLEGGLEVTTIREIILPLGSLNKTPWGSHKLVCSQGTNTLGKVRLDSDEITVAPEMRQAVEMVGSVSMARVQSDPLELTIQRFLEHGADQQFPFVHRGNSTSLQNCTVFCINHCNFGFFC